MEFSIDDVEFFGEVDLSDIIEIKSNRTNYNVYYSSKTLDELFKEVYENEDFIFIDRNVYNLSVDTFKSLNKTNIVVFDAIEENKNIESVLQITDALYNINFTKKNKLIVIGGGITQDVGGFAAAIYKRGIKWTFIPTTLLSMTDSCIGSKVSINRKSKNILGMFVAPNKIFISDYFFESLNKNDIISGLGESLKLCLIGGNNTFELFKDKFENSDYISIIKLSSLIKKKIIEYDEFENNVRKVLNYGHTIGHAIESTTNFFIPHGIAVLIGMYIKNNLFYNDKHLEINKIILNLIDPIYLNLIFDYDIFINHILSDKKNNGNNICFILLDEIGKSKITYTQIENINSKLKQIVSNLFRIN
jgi:3-dehydroquinate synthase